MSNGPVLDRRAYEQQGTGPKVVLPCEAWYDDR
jgi:hypothetical protein